MSISIKLNESDLCSLCVDATEGINGTIFHVESKASSVLIQSILRELKYQYTVYIDEDESDCILITSTLPWKLYESLKKRV